MATTSPKKKRRSRSKLSPMESMESVKMMVRRLYGAQRGRIGADQRVDRLVKEGRMSKKVADELFSTTLKMERAIEKEYEKAVKREIEDWPIMTEWLGKVKGIGPRLAGLLLANIGTPTRFENPAKLWAYSGLHVVNGKAPKQTRGVKSNWSTEMRATCFKVALSFVKAGGPYRKLYDEYKDYLIGREVSKGNCIWRAPTVEEAADKVWPSGTKWVLEHFPRKLPAMGKVTVVAEKEGDRDGRVVKTTKDMKGEKMPEWTYGRLHAMALRRTAKIFLAHLWAVWWKIETGDEAPRKVFVIESQNKECKSHTHEIDPWSMIEP